MGGTRLKIEYGFETDKEIAAEWWMLSCHKDGTNIGINGIFAGKPRELHVNKAVDVTVTDKPIIPYGNVGGG